MKNTAVVVFSGGQNSTTCLIQALKHYDEVHCLTFDYGQRHREEVEIARHLVKTLGVTAHKRVDITTLNELGLSRPWYDPVTVSGKGSPGVASGPLLPGRHLLFVTLAALYACQLQARTVISGVAEAQVSGDREGRDTVVKTLNEAVALGMDYPLTLKTPLMGLSKAQIWAMADAYKQLNLVRYQTLTCYHGLLGSGCGQCQACHRRARGLEEYLMNRRPLLNAFIGRPA